MLSVNTSNSNTISKSIIYEIIDQKPLFYKGYQENTQGLNQGEDIMGCSGLQALIISTLLRFLYQHLPEETYEIVTNEAGLHLDDNDNLATDIGIYDIKVLASTEINDKYLEVAPKIVIEIDTKADTQNFDDAVDYYHRKTKKLLDFGVEKVIWITSKSQRVMVATADTDWKTLDWEKEIELLDEIRFSMKTLLKKRRVMMDKTS
jgi:hypothetical protein